MAPGKHAKQSKENWKNFYVTNNWGAIYHVCPPLKVQRQRVVNYDSRLIKTYIPDHSVSRPSILPAVKVLLVRTLSDFIASSLHSSLYDFPDETKLCFTLHCTHSSASTAVSQSLPSCSSSVSSSSSNVSPLPASLTLSVLSFSCFFWNSFCRY